jgi:hypothetical protein
MLAVLCSEGRRESQPSFHVAAVTFRGTTDPDYAGSAWIAHDLLHDAILPALAGKVRDSRQPHGPDARRLKLCPVCDRLLVVKRHDQTSILGQCTNTKRQRCFRNRDKQREYKEHHRKNRLAKTARAQLWAERMLETSKKRGSSDCELLGRALARARRHLDPRVPVPWPDPLPRRRFAREFRRPYRIRKRSMCVRRRCGSIRLPACAFTARGAKKGCARSGRKRCCCCDRGSDASPEPTTNRS